MYKGYTLTEYPTAKTNILPERAHKRCVKAIIQGTFEFKLI